MELVLDDPSLLVDRCCLDGAWVGDPTDPVTDPATGAVIARVPHFGAAEAALAVDAAARALPGWAGALAKERGKVLRRWAELVTAHVDDLTRILTAEQGKPLAEARGEVLSAAAYIDFFAEEAKRIHGELLPPQRPGERILVVRQPIGVVAAITPWNFPAGMVARKVAPAVAAGCTVVLKPAPDTPLTALALAALGQRAGLPAGVLNVVTGDAAAIGEVLCTAPAVRFIGFTGSTPVGKHLMRQAAEGVKKLGLELGGHAPFIVLDDADIGKAVGGAMAAKFRNMGQTCICANRFWVHAAIHDRFLEALADAVAGLRLGPGAAEGVSQGPLINTAAVAKVESHVRDALAHGARLVAGGRPHALGGTFYEPTLLADVPDGTLIAREETFGPVAAVTRFEDDAEVVARANASPYGLAAYVYGRSIGRVLGIAEALECGMVGINSVLLGTEVAPIGGMKQSGIGREGSRHGIEEYCELKYILLADG